MSSWKVGLVGAGYWSDKHLSAWSRIPNVEVTAICDKDKEKLLAKAKQYNLSKENIYLSVEEMLEHADIHILDIVTGPETHKEFVQLAAASGKHIMCQKPFASSLQEAHEMVDIAQKANVRLMVTENWRWLQPFQIIKGVLEKESLGKLKVARYIHSDFYTPRMSPEKALPQPFFRTMPNLLFYEMGVHWFDTWRFLFGEPKRLYAETTRFSSHVIGEDSGIITLGYEDFYGVLDMSWATRRDIHEAFEDQVLPNHMEQLSIDGTKATLKLYINGDITIIDNRGIETKIADKTSFDYMESHFRLQSHFIHCLENNIEFQTSGKDNLKTLQLTFGTYQSAKEHQVIHLNTIT